MMLSTRKRIEQELERRSGGRRYPGDDPYMVDVHQREPGNWQAVACWRVANGKVGGDIHEHTTLQLMRATADECADHDQAERRLLAAIFEAPEVSP